MKKIYTSIDIGSDTIRILVGEYFQNELRVLAVSSVKSKGIRNGLIYDADLALERLKIAINDINERINIPIRKAIITIPSIDVEYNLVRANTPVASEDKIVTNREIITVQNKVIKDVMPNMELVNLLPIDFTIYENGSEIETLDDPTNKICDRVGIRAMMVTVPKSVIVSYVKLVESAGIEVVDLTLNSVSDFEEISNDDLKQGHVGLINIGKDITTVSVYNKGIITNSSIIKSGAKVIDDDISYIYYVGRKAARKLKENFGIAHPRYANKNETFEIKDNNQKYVSINQYELSELINKRLVEILNNAKNELKLLTNKQIRYIMILGGITDIPGIDFVIEDVFGKNAGTYSLNTLGIRKARFITVSGSIKHFVKKLKLRGKKYTMFSSDDTDTLVHNKNRIGRSDSVVGKVISYLFDN